MIRAGGLRALAVVAVVGVLGTACGGGSPDADGPSPTATERPSPSATPTPTPTPPPAPPPPPPPPPASLLSGVPFSVDGPALAVKIDNVSRAFPHYGLTSADVVYVQQVEGGLTRLAAVYSTTLPPKVGPIRSARITDIDMLAQYGPIAFAYSGANGGLSDEIGATGLRNVSGDVGMTGYWRERGRPGTHDFFGAPAELLARAPDTPATRDVGFRFGALPAGGRPASEVGAGFPSTTVGFTFDPATGRWVYSLDGRVDSNADEGPAGGTTVIVQYVQVSPSEYGDSVGGNTPFSATVGSGPGVVLRDGQAFDITWQRPAPEAPTQFLYNGADMPLAPGQVWVVLLDAASPAAIA